MSSTDAKKVKRKKGRKAGKNGSTSVPLQIGASSQQTHLDGAAALAEAHGIKELERLMDEEDGMETRGLGSAGANGPLPYRYLGGEHCLLCRCPKPANEKDADKLSGENSEDEALVQLPLWVCADCKKTVEEEEKKGPVLEQDLKLDAPFFTDLASGDTSVGSTICSCDACLERRQIQAELDKETQELQQCWMELRHSVRYVYREAGTGLSESSEDPSQVKPDVNKMKELVHRLVTRDPHQLFQRLESQGREYVIEMKVRLLRQLTTGHKTPPQAKQFVSMLLEEYSNLCSAAKTLASFLTELQEHLKRFSLTWELHNKHLFQSIIYTDPLVQNSLTMLITQLRLGAASKESYHEDTYPNILHRYFKFDDEMSVISVVWRDCQQLLEEYNEEQAAMKAKQKMLKEDWEFFRAQRKILEQAVINDSSAPSSPTAHSPSSPHNFEAQFTETMRHILQGTKPAADECHCPHCNRKRCPCDECTISHMITCGIINPEVVDQMPAHSGAAFHHDPNRYHINVKPPSMSSTTSSSGSSSPIVVEPGALSMPYHEEPLAFDLGDEDDVDDDIPEEIDEEGSRDSDDESSEDENDARGDGDGEACSANEGLAVLPGLMKEAMAALTEDDIQEVSPERGLTEGCDCSHCAQKAKVEKLKLDENQCQCHACLIQSGQSVATSLPQHLPSAPKPASLHLYPHIHGANALPCHTGALHSTSTGLGSLLHPHLYDLHTPLRQGTKSSQQKDQLNLDLESHEALQEHIYHAYGEWDNSYDSSKFILSSHKYGGSLGSELFNTPPPPLLSSNPFISDALSSNTPPIESILKNLPTSSVATTTVTSSQSSSAARDQTPCLKNFKPINRTLLKNMNHSAANQVSTMSSTTITTTTNNVMVTAAASGVIMDMPLMMSDHYKHNPFIPTTSITFSTNNLNSNVTAGAASSSQPFKYTTEMLRSAAALKEEAARALGNLGSQPINTSYNLGTCSHANVVPIHTSNQLGLASRTGATANINHNLISSAPLVSSGVTQLTHHQVTQHQPVSSCGTGTPVCIEPDCDGQDDDYNSIEDDSCSEQSSSASTSAQKDGKYCDCCYCEVFGHSTPAQAPTSKNYPENRERLLLKLKKKNEAKTVPDVPDVHHIQEIHHVQAQQHPVKKITVQKPQNLTCTAVAKANPPRDLSIEQLIQYIEGSQENCQNPDKQASSRAAKRARQKQRKAEEKAKQEVKENNQAKQKKETVCKMEGVTTCQHDSLQRKKKAKQKKEGSPPGMTLKQGSITVTTNGCIMNGTTVLAHHTVTGLKNSQAGKGSLLNKALKEMAATGQRVSQKGAASKKESQGKDSPAATRKITDKSRQEESAGKHKTHETTRPGSSDGRKPVQLGQGVQSQPQAVNSRNKTLSSEAGSRKKGRNPKVDVMGHEVAESPPQVPAKQARQAKNTMSVSHNNHMLQNGQQPRKQQVVDLSARGLSQSREHKMQQDKSVTKSKSDTAVLTEASHSRNEQTSKSDQTPGSAKKKNKKKGKGSDDLTSVDEIFMPKPGLDLENGDLDESERELEEFKRFCLDSTPKRGAKLQVNMNLKDIFNKKSKSGISCA